MGEDAGRRPKPVRICEANTRILRADYQLNMDAMFIESQLAMSRTDGPSKPAENRTLLQNLRARHLKTG